MPQHHRKANGLKILKASHPRMRALRRAGHEARIHGHKVWKSSFLIMDHLRRHPPKKKRPRVLDIGCGWGLLGLWCAKHLDARVHGVDADVNVLPYVELHAAENALAMSAERRTFEELRKRDLEGYDLVVGADVCFWDELADDLYKMIRRARNADVPRIMIADPGRPPFHALAERCEKRLDRVERLEKSLKRPVKGWGEILIVR